MSEEKIYIGTAKTIKGKFGAFLRLSIHEDDLKKLQENLDNGWVNVNITKRKEVSAKGATHYGVIDTWKPEKKAPKQVEQIEDLPF